MRKITLPDVGGKPMHTKDRLAQELRAIDLEGMAALASMGKYDDFLSDDAMAITTLVNELAKVGTVGAIALRKRVIEGEFDATKEESDAWAASPEGQEAFRMLIRGKE
jgi:hypothetical protein